MSEVASKLQKAITEGHRAAMHHHADNASERHKDTIHNLFEHWEREIAQLWAEKGLPDFNAEVFSPEIRQAFGAITEPTHQADFIFSLMALLGVALSGTFAAAAGINQQLTERGLHASADIKPEAMTTAGLAVRGFIDAGTATEWMADVGTKSAVGQAYIDSAYNHIPNEALLQLVRLGIISRDRAAAIMRYAGLPQQEIDDFLSLQFLPPSAAFAAQARTQGQITNEQFEQLLRLNGISPEWSNAIYETEGQTMPPQMANELFRRGYIDTAAYEQILLESNLKNKYVPLLKDLRWRIPPMRQTVAAFHNGSIDRVTAADYLSKLGFDESVQKWMLDSAAKSSVSAGKHLSMQQHLAAYEAQLESREDATAALMAIGWANADIELEFDVADHRSSLARVSKAANAIGTRYVGWKIDRHSALVALDALGLPAAARDEALSAWDIEREERRPRLTLTQLEHGFKKGAVNEAGVRAFLADMGYDTNQVNFLWATYF